MIFSITSFLDPICIIMSKGYINHIYKVILTMLITAIHFICARVVLLTFILVASDRSVRSVMTGSVPAPSRTSRGTRPAGPTQDAVPGTVTAP